MDIIFLLEMSHFENVFITPFTVSLSNTTPSQRKKNISSLSDTFNFCQSKQEQNKV